MMIWFIFAIFALCWTITVNSPNYLRSKRERAQADREYEASRRFQARLDARTPEQVAADKELDEARVGAEIADARLHRWFENPNFANAPSDCYPWRGEPEYDSDRAESTAARARLTLAIERRKSCVYPDPRAPA
jgi:hypothetical protein